MVEKLLSGLSLVIPAHNSEKVIEKSVDEYYKTFSKKFKDLEIIIVCNDCWDNTPELCRELAKKYPIKLIEISQRGKGHALIQGFNNSRFDIIGFLDADNPFNLNKVIEMIEELAQCDIVIASKFLRRGLKAQDSLTRRFLSIGAWTVSKVFFNMNFRDTQAGAKFFKKKVWNQIDTDFICRGFDFDIELLYKAKKAGFKIGEKYIPVEYEKFSTFRLKYILGMLKRIFKLRFLK